MPTMPEIKEVHKKKMHVLVSPNGTIQSLTLSVDYPSCVLNIRMLHKAGITPSFHELVKMKGFKILPIIVSFEEEKQEKTITTD